MEWFMGWVQWILPWPVCSIMIISLTLYPFHILDTDFRHKLAIAAQSTQSLQSYFCPTTQKCYIRPRSVLTVLFYPFRPRHAPLVDPSMNYDNVANTCNRYVFVVSPLKSSKHDYRRPTNSLQHHLGWMPRARVWGGQICLRVCVCVGKSNKSTICKSSSSSSTTTQQPQPRSFKSRNTEPPTNIDNHFLFTFYTSCRNFFSLSLSLSFALHLISSTNISLNVHILYVMFILLLHRPSRPL